MYSLDCFYYKKKFNTISELIKDVLESGMDPNYEVLRNGRPEGILLADLMMGGA